MNIKSPTRILASLFLMLATSTYGQDIERGMNLSYASEVIVQQGGVSVTLTDFQAFFDDHFSGTESADLLTNVSQIADILSSLVRNEWVFQQGVVAGLVDDPIMQARLRRAVLNRLGAIYRDWFVEQSQLDDYTARAREMYVAHPERFLGTVSYDFEHILIAAEPVRSEIEAMERVLAAHQRLRDGASFQVVAVEYSEDEAAATNDHTYREVTLTGLVAPLAAVLRDSQEGQLTAPVRSQFGWHIVRLVSINPAEVLPWDLVRERAIEQARTEHLSRAWQRQLREAQSQPAIFPPGAISRLLAAYGIDSLGIDMQQLADELEP